MVKREGDKMVVSSDTAPTTDAYQIEYQEMSGDCRAQELEPSKSYRYAVGGAHELKADTRPDELPHNMTEEMSYVDHQEHKTTPDTTETRCSEV
jgi:hypothetical protein